MIDELTRSLGRVLGPRKMMPNAKRGSVFDDVTAGVEANRGAVEWKVDQNGALGIGELIFLFRSRRGLSSWLLSNGR